MGQSAGRVFVEFSVKGVFTIRAVLERERSLGSSMRFFLDCFSAPEALLAAVRHFARDCGGEATLLPTGTHWVPVIVIQIPGAGTIEEFTDLARRLMLRLAAAQPRTS